MSSTSKNFRVIDCDENEHFITADSVQSIDHPDYYLLLFVEDGVYIAGFINPQVWKEQP